MAVTPEEIGLGGCWQVIAVERYRQLHHQSKESASLEIGYYASSLALQERTDDQVLAAIRAHWSAIENGTHHRRDVTLGEDNCSTANRNGAAVLASFRNLANGVYELQKERGATTVDTLKSWCQQQNFTSIWPLLKR